MDGQPNIVAGLPFSVHHISLNGLNLRNLSLSLYSAMFKRRLYAYLIWFTFLIVLFSYIIMAIRFPVAYIWATYEDLYGEWAQFYNFLIAMILSIYIAILSKRYRYFFAVLAIACFYTIMEEISWGQRLLGISSPDLFKSRNLQGELNFHNFLTGPYHTTLKTFITYVLAFGISLYGCVYPVLLHLRLRAAIKLHTKGIAAPPPYLTPFFLTASFLELELLSFNEAEIAEIMVGMGIAFMTLHYVFVLRNKLPVHSGQAYDYKKSLSLALQFGILVSTVVICAVTTTHILYSKPKNRVQIDRRIENGIKKFAHRYTRYHMWDTAVNLYLRHYKLSPRSTTRMRRLALAYKRAGNQKFYEIYAKKALQEAFQRYKKNPHDPGRIRSLALAYRTLGEKKKEYLYLQKALRLLKVRMKRNPKSASVAYSLGKTYQLMGKYDQALKQYRRAYKLKPTIKRYRKAYYKLKVDMSST